MKSTEIKVGGLYHDGKLAVREVIAIAPDDAGIERVEYRILAAKVMQEYSYAEKKMISVVGSTTSCHLASFASWAKLGLSHAECQALLALLSAKRVKLPPGELELMVSIADVFADGDSQAGPGMKVPFDLSETRAAKSLAHKGLFDVREVVPGRGGMMTLTAIGAAWVRHRLAPDAGSVELISAS